MYMVDCSAVAPRFGVIISDQIFFIAVVDLAEYMGGCCCVSTIQSARIYGMSILGDTFLKNQLAVCDVGAAGMRFAAQEV